MLARINIMEIAVKKINFKYNLLLFSLETRKCQPCHKTCAKCSGPAPTNCEVCEVDLYKRNDGLCVTEKECPSGAFANKSI